MLRIASPPASAIAPNAPVARVPVRVSPWRSFCSALVGHGVHLSCEGSARGAQCIVVGAGGGDVGELRPCRVDTANDRHVYFS